MEALEYACLPVFEALTNLSSQEEQGKEQVLNQFKEKLVHMQARARRLECDPQDIEDANYALVALVDERVPKQCPQLRPEWRNALQQLCYNENTAGEGFFERLTGLLRQPRRQHAARIYALCLAFGFEGVYQNKSEMATLRLGVRRYLGLPSKTLPMNPRPVAEPPHRQRRGLNYALIFSAAAVFCVAIVGTAMVRRKLNLETRQIIQGLTALPSVRVIQE